MKTSPRHCSLTFLIDLFKHLGPEPELALVRLDLRRRRRGAIWQRP